MYLAAWFCIWRFPKIGVSPNHPFLVRSSIIGHPFWDTPIPGNPHLKNQSMQQICWVYPGSFAPRYCSSDSWLGNSSKIWRHPLGIPTAVQRGWKATLQKTGWFWDFWCLRVYMLVGVMLTEMNDSDEEISSTTMVTMAWLCRIRESLQLAQTKEKSSHDQSEVIHKDHWWLDDIRIINGYGQSQSLQPIHFWPICLGWTFIDHIPRRWSVQDSKWLDFLAEFMLSGLIYFKSYMWPKVSGLNTNYGQYESL